MDLMLLEKIKRLSIIAMVSDDELMEQLVLKGGNAIDLIYQLSGRASIDIDFSIQSEFQKDQLQNLRLKVEESLISTFKPEGLVVIDVRFNERPPVVNEKYRDFWGGYRIEFKVVSQDIYEGNSGNISALRRRAVIIGPHNSTVIHIEISKFECCRYKKAMELEGFTVYVYTIEMMVIEKIRAICQQVPEYRDILKTHTPVARARDFFDIFVMLESYPINFNDQRIKNIIREVFEIKRVPLSYLKKVKEQREFHRPDFISVRDTVKPGVQLKDSDFYFDYVVSLLDSIAF